MIYEKICQLNGLNTTSKTIKINKTSRIQEMHILIGQMLCNALEYKLGYSHLVKEEK